MPHNKKQGLCLSFIMSFIMIYVMAALNIDVRQGYCSAHPDAGGGSAVPAPGPAGGGIN